MKRILYIILASTVLYSCSTTGLIQTTPFGEEPAEYRERAVYVLPQTVLNVVVDFEKETYIPGPYRLYTEKYLGLKDYITEPGYNFRILNVEVSSFKEPDPEEFYSINVVSGHFAWDEYLRLSKFGLLMNPSTHIAMDLGRESEGEIDQEPLFTDISVKKNLAEITDTLYKTIIRDSSYVRVPVLRKQREAKTLEQKAEEAANFIIKIRKRRFKLLAGQYDVFPEGKALAISVEELDKLEKEYLELFIGKRIKTTYRQKLIVIPESTREVQTFNIAYFSPLNGLSVPDEGNGNPLQMVVKPQNKLKNLSSELSGSEAGKNALIYRIPDLADISVNINNENLYEGRIPVYQLGKKLEIPVKVSSK